MLPEGHGDSCFSSGVVSFSSLASPKPALGLCMTPQDGHEVMHVPSSQRDFWSQSTGKIKTGDSKSKETPVNVLSWNNSVAVMLQNVTTMDKKRQVIKNILSNSPPVSMTRFLIKPG